MTYHVHAFSSVESDIATISQPEQEKVRKAIRSLADNPRPPGVKKLASISPGIKNAYRIRVGNYRIGYRIFDGKLVVVVVAAAKRGEIYPILKRRLR